MDARALSVDVHGAGGATAFYMTGVTVELRQEKCMQPIAFRCIRRYDTAAATHIDGQSEETTRNG